MHTRAADIVNCLRPDSGIVAANQRGAALRWRGLLPGDCTVYFMRDNGSSWTRTRDLRNALPLSLTTLVLLGQGGNTTLAPLSFSVRGSAPLTSYPGCFSTKDDSQLMCRVLGLGRGRLERPCWPIALIYFHSYAPVIIIKKCHHFFYTTQEFRRDSA